VRRVTPTAAWRPSVLRLGVGLRIWALWVGGSGLVTGWVGVLMAGMESLGRSRAPRRSRLRNVARSLVVAFSIAIDAAAATRLLTVADSVTRQAHARTAIVVAISIT